jgi:hypothetical protein
MAKIIVTYKNLVCRLGCSNSQYGKNWGQDGTANASERGKGANSG